jgi:hypothetical protein
VAYADGRGISGAAEHEHGAGGLGENDEGVAWAEEPPAVFEEDLVVGLARPRGVVEPVPARWRGGECGGRG